MPTTIYSVYIHICVISKKSYIGVTKNGIKKRFKTHKQKAKSGSNYHFHNAIRKYGTENFSSEILFSTKNKSEAYKKEVYYIALHNTFNEGYNMTEGGENPPVLIGENNPQFGTHPIRSKKTRKQMSESHKNVPLSKQHREAIAKGNTGYIVTEETKKKLSKIFMGRTSPNKGKSPKKYTCPHCMGKFSLSNVNRWHGDKCKSLNN